MGWWETPTPQTRQVERFSGVAYLASRGFLERPDSRSSVGSSQVTAKTSSSLCRNFSVAGQWNEIDRQFQQLNGKFEEQLRREKALLGLRWVRLGKGWVQWWAEWQHLVSGRLDRPPETGRCLPQCEIILSRSSRVTQQHWKLWICAGSMTIWSGHFWGLLTKSDASAAGDGGEV